MPYPNGFLYLTAHWAVAGTSEIGQFGLKFDSTAPASSSLVGAAAARLSTMWGSATMAIDSNFRLIFARLAAIGPDGLYVPGTPSYDFTYASPVPGSGGIAGPVYPLQVAHVMTLRTNLPRGRAHVGRIYLPAVNAAIQSNYQWQTAQINNRNNTVSAMITGLNTDMPGKCTIFSKVGSGAKQLVTAVNSDTRADVQRRRAKQQTGTVGIAGTVT